MFDLFSKILFGNSDPENEPLIIDLFDSSKRLNRNAELDAVHSPLRKFSDIAIEHIHPNLEQVRTFFDEGEVNELAKSMKLNGILQPIIVRPHPTVDVDSLTHQFQIAAGERRWRAAKMAKIDSIPCLILNLNNLQVAQIGLIENVQRASLQPLEEARAFKALNDTYGHTAQQIADTIGKTRSYVTNRMRLLSLPASVKNSLSNREISFGHARAIITSASPTMLSKKIISEKLSVRETEQMVNSIKQSTKKQLRNKKSCDPNVELLVSRLKRAIPNQASFKVLGKGHFSLKAEFASLEEFKQFVLLVENGAEKTKFGSSQSASGLF